MCLKIENLDSSKIKYHITELIRIDKSIREVMGADYSLEEWGCDNFLLDIPGKWEFSFIATKNNILIGFIIVSQPDSKWLHINRVAVSSEMQHKGIGRILIKQLISNAENNSINKITLFVNGNNINGLHFYDSLGFKPLSGFELLMLLNKKNKGNEYKGQYSMDNNGNMYYMYVLNL